MRLLCTVLATAFVSSGCTSAATQAKAARTVSSEPPIIERVVPASGPAGTAYPLQVTIEGRNFADSANTVTFGPVTLRGQPSSENGTRIVVHLPKEMPATGEAPPAVLQPGTYRITVSTVAGESNAVVFQLTPEPGAIP